MNRDYLWNRTGEDPEIEKLENALRAFRYRETAPPALPSKILPFPNKAAIIEKSPRGFFRLSLAFAACAALVFASLGVWFHLSGDKIEIAEDSTEPVASQQIEKNASEARIENHDVLIVKNDESPPAKVKNSNKNSKGGEPKIVKIRKIAPTNAAANRAIARNAENEKPAVKLTKDERYAYEQLMLALSITSSKLKLVKDKVENVEEQSGAHGDSR